MDEVWKTVAADFSDLTNLAEVVRVAIRLLIAAVLGGVLGYDRERGGHTAGLRTHMLVAVGAALFVLVPQQAKWADGDVSRVVQGILAGIGFLGAGAILHDREGQQVRGLTTAAGIWLTAAIGVAVGLGRESTAILSTVLALVILALLPRVERLIPTKPSNENGAGDAAVGAKKADRPAKR